MEVMGVSNLRHILTGFHEMVTGTEQHGFFEAPAPGWYARQCACVQGKGMYRASECKGVLATTCVSLYANCLHFRQSRILKCRHLVADR